MDIFRQAGEALSQFGREAGKQAEVLGLQTKLGGLETELERIYAEAGKRAEELVRAQQIRDDEIKVILRRAKDLQDEMMQVRREIQQLQSGATPAASSEPQPQPETAAQSQPVPQPTVEVQTGPRCAQCGKLAPAGETFCPNCGAKLPRPEA